MCCTPSSAQHLENTGGKREGLVVGTRIWHWMEACCAHGGLSGRVSPPQVVLSLGDLCGDSSHSIPKKSSFSAKYQFSVVGGVDFGVLPSCGIGLSHRVVYFTGIFIHLPFLPSW